MRQLNHEMKSASLGRKQNPSELDYFDKPLPDEPEKSNKRSALNRGTLMASPSVKVNYVSVISYILPNNGPKTNVPAEYRPVISHPSGFEHQVHVGFDPETGEFSGLPDTWARILQHSDISVTERKKNPKGLLEVMGFWNETRFERPEPKVRIKQLTFTFVSFYLNSTTTAKIWWRQSQHPRFRRPKLFRQVQLRIIQTLHRTRRLLHHRHHQEANTRAQSTPSPFSLKSRLFSLGKNTTFVLKVYLLLGQLTVL